MPCTVAKDTRCGSRDRVQEWAIENDADSVVAKTVTVTSRVRMLLLYLVKTNANKGESTELFWATACACAGRGVKYSVYSVVFVLSAGVYIIWPRPRALITVIALSYLHEKAQVATAQEKVQVPVAASSN